MFLTVLVSLRTGEGSMLMLPSADRENGGFGTPVHTEFDKQVRYVILHRLLGEEELAGDLTICLTSDDEIEDASLSRGQPAESFVLFVATKALSGQGNQVWVEQGLPKRRASNGSD